MLWSQNLLSAARRDFGGSGGGGGGGSGGGGRSSGGGRAQLFDAAARHPHDLSQPDPFAALGEAQEATNTGGKLDLDPSELMMIAIEKEHRDQGAHAGEHGHGDFFHHS
jgi:hypothetical protein